MSLIIIPPDGKRIEEFAFDPVKDNKSIYVTSNPNVNCTPGKQMSYAIRTVTNSKPLNYTVVQDKELNVSAGVTVSPTGVVTWKVPANETRDRLRIEVKLSGGSDQVARHYIDLTNTAAPAPNNPAPKAKTPKSEAPVADCTRRQTRSRIERPTADLAARDEGAARRSRPCPGRFATPALLAADATSFSTAQASASSSCSTSTRSKIEHTFPVNRGRHSLCREHGEVVLDLSRHQVRHPRQPGDVQAGGGHDARSHAAARPSRRWAAPLRGH